MSHDNTAQFSSEDEQMDAAIRKAKDTIRQFFEAFFEPTKKQKSFLLKVVFDEGEQREYIWLADLDFGGDKPTGVVANEPGLPSLKFMQRVEFEPSYISDWMYVAAAFWSAVAKPRRGDDTAFDGTPSERTSHRLQASRPRGLTSSALLA